MLCDKCGNNQATVHLTEISDEQMTELHLCEDCARQKSAQMEQQFGLGDLLAGLTDLGKPGGKKEAEAIEVKCPNCGLTFEDFRKIVRLGCSECYATLTEHTLTHRIYRCGPGWLEGNHSRIGRNSTRREGAEP